MLSVKSVMKQITDPEKILKIVGEILCSIDPTFTQVEENYRTTIKQLQEEIGNTISPSISEYIVAKEHKLCEELLYVTWLGFQQNLKCFRDPINTKFLDLDYEDILREGRMHTLPEVRKALDTIDAFWGVMRMLPEEKKNLDDGVLDYICHIETIGFKLAHYFGFILADSLLEHLVPGYCNDACTTMRYKANLERYMEKDLDILE